MENSGPIWHRKYGSRLPQESCHRGAIVTANKNVVFYATYLFSSSPSSSFIQAGILVLVQAITIMTLFPALLKLDTRRRARHRMDVLCCLRQPVSVSAAAAAAADTTGMSSSPPLSPPYSLPPPTCSTEGVVRVVETTSTKVRLSGNAVATVKVSVSTQKQPSTLIHGFQPCGGVNVSSISYPFFIQ